MKQRKKRTTRLVKTLQGLAPTFFSLAIASTATGIAMSMLGKTFAEEVRQRLLEFKLMGVIEIEKNDKSKRTIEYHPIKGIRKYIKGFLKRNPKWKAQDEVSFEIKTGRIILTRVYRTYHKKREEEDHYCSECGRSYNDYD
jgi:hypothetical protein